MQTKNSDPNTPRSAVIAIDMANDFLFEPGTIAASGGADYQRRAQAILPRMADFLAAARSSGIKVIYVTDAHSPDDSELRKWPPHAMKGTPEAEIPAIIAPEAGDILIEKNTYSPFVFTDLDAQLKEGGITRLYMTGLHTDCCVRHTSGDAFQRGYDLIWVSDLLQAFTEEAHLSGLAYFKTWYAVDEKRQFKTSAELIAQ